MQPLLFKDNPFKWSLFYTSAAATIVMFIILCTLSAWSVHLGNQVSQTLHDVDEIMPEIKETLALVKYICKMENFTKVYGDVC